MAQLPELENTTADDGEHCGYCGYPFNAGDDILIEHYNVDIVCSQDCYDKLLAYRLERSR